jgi:hypothetical protein
VTSVAYPAYVLGRNPEHRISCVSYAHELALKHARDFQQVASSPWYRQVFPQTVPLRDVEEIFETTHRGFRRSTSLAGGLTGFGANTIIVDDPMKVDDALQRSARQRANELFADTLYSRLDRKTDGVIIVVMQRVHAEDLVGYLLRQGGWEHLNLPAIALQDEDIPIGNGQFHHRKKGDLLNPEFEPLSSTSFVACTISAAMPSQVAKRRFTASTGEISTAGSICSATRPSYSQAAWCERCSSGRWSWEERPRTGGNSAGKRAAFPSNKGPPVGSCEFINMVFTFDAHARSSPPVSGFGACVGYRSGRVQRSIAHRIARIPMLV